MTKQKRDVFQLRLRSGERERWVEAAGEKRLSDWARKALDEAALAQLAVRREGEQRRAERERVKAIMSPAFKTDFKR